ALNKLKAHDLAFQGFRQVCSHASTISQFHHRILIVVVVQVLRLNPEPGCGNADSAWNCGLLLLMSSVSATMPTVQRLQSLDYFRLARALYEDPESQATCTA